MEIKDEDEEDFEETRIEKYMSRTYLKYLYADATYQLYKYVISSSESVDLLSYDNFLSNIYQNFDSIPLDVENLNNILQQNNIDIDKNLIFYITYLKKLNETDMYIDNIFDNISDNVNKDDYDYFNKVGSNFNIKFDNVDIFNMRFKQWISSYSRLFDEQETKISFYDDNVYGDLNSQYDNAIDKGIKEKTKSNFLIKSYNITIKNIEYENKIVSPLIGIDIFDGAELSYDIPYIKYSYELNNKKKEYHKYFSGDINGKIPENIPMEDIEPKYSNSIIFLLWDGTEVHYDLDNNIIDVLIEDEITVKKEEDLPCKNNKQMEVKNNKQNKVINSIERVFKVNINKDYIECYGYSVEFDIYDVDLDNIYRTWTYLITNDILFSNYIFFNENDRTIETKETHYYHFFNKDDYPDELTLSGSEVKDPYDIRFTMKTTKSKENNQESTKTSYITIFARNTNSYNRRYFAYFDQLSYILLKLLVIAESRNDEINKLYKKYIEEGLFEKKITTTEKAYRKIDNSKLRALQRELPFLEDPLIRYSKQVQKKDQPIPIPDDKIYEIQEKIFVSNTGKKYNVQVMRYPGPDLQKDEIITKDKHLVKVKEGIDFNKLSKGVNLVCYDEEDPLPLEKQNRLFPGVKENKYQIINENTTYLPKCFTSNQYKKPKYNEYYKGITSKKEQSKIMFKENKILSKNHIGELNDSIKTILSVQQSDSIGDFLRLGVLSSKSSLYHCVLYAIDEKYQEILLKNQSDDELEKYVSEKRKQLATNIFPSLLKQELYDVSDEFIITNLANSEVYLDPLLYVRALEQYHDIRIYQFSRKSKDNYVLDIPRHKYIYCRNSYITEVVIIYVDYTQKNTKYPQCEIIIAKNLDSTFKNEINYHTFFPKEMNIYLNDIHDKLYNNYTFSFQDITMKINYKDSLYKYPSMKNYHNIYSKIDIPEIIENAIISFNKQQYKNSKLNLEGINLDILNISREPELFYFLRSYSYDYKNKIIASFARITHCIIDKYGKMRSYLIQYPQTTYKSKNIIVFYPPSQPQLIPELPNKYSNPLKPYFEDVVSFFGTNIYSLSTHKNFITGLWYSIHDISEAFYIPIKPTNLSNLTNNKYLPLIDINKSYSFDNIVQGSEHPMVSVFVNRSTRYNSLKKIFSFILQTIRWIYSIYIINIKINIEPGKSFNIKYYLQKFITDYIIYEKETFKGDSFYIYSDILKMPRIFPKYNLVEQSLNYTKEKICTSLIRPFNNQDKIWLYSKKMFDNCVYFLKDYSFFIDGFIDIGIIPTKVEGYYEKISDFRQRSNQYIFQSFIDMKQFIIDRTTNYREIINSLKNINQSQTTPIFYQDEENRIYIIQNVFQAEKERAIKVSQTWYQKHINIGYYPTIDEDQNYPHVILTIGEDGNFSIYQNNSIPQQPYLLILSYSTTEFSAILPLF